MYVLIVKKYAWKTCECIYQIALTHMFWNGTYGCWLKLFFTMYLYILCDELIRYLIVFFMICMHWYKARMNWFKLMILENWFFMIDWRKYIVLIQILLWIEEKKKRFLWIESVTLEFWIWDMVYGGNASLSISVSLYLYQIHIWGSVLNFIYLYKPI